MKQLLAHLILVFAFVASTVHAPAFAHERPASHHSDHGASLSHETLTDHLGNDAPSHDGAGDGLHHHHCPTALEARGIEIALDVTISKSQWLIRRANLLVSYSQAPPTEPPSA